MAHVNLGFLSLRAIPDPAGDIDPPEHRASLERAADDFRAAVRVHPNLPQAHNNLGTLRVRRGRRDEAHAGYLQALRFSLMIRRARHCVFLDRMAQERKPLPHALSRQIQRASLRADELEMGSILAGFDEAVTAYRSALAINRPMRRRMNIAPRLAARPRAEAVAS